MGDNNIRYADDISEMLRHNTTITNLVLSENNFTDRDAAMLAQVIEVSYCRRKLIVVSFIIIELSVEKHIYLTVYRNDILVVHKSVKCDYL